MKMLFQRKLLWVFILPVLISGCLVGGKFTKPTVSQTPRQYNQVTTPSDSISAIQWFELYQDTVLRRFIRITLDSNRNLLAAAARIEESREIAGIVKANLYPFFGYQIMAGGGTAGTGSQKGAGGIVKRGYKGYATLNWEIDLWGRIRHANKAALSQYLGDIENRNALVVSLVAEVSQLY